MISDRKRAFLICGLSLFAVLWINLIDLFFSDKFPVIALNTYHNRNMYNWITIVFAGLAVYESIYSLGLTIFLKRKKIFPMIPRFGNALIEISIPTIMIYFSFKILGSVQSLVIPILFLYFIFISLSALRLMFTISLFTGIVAGAQYFWISLYVINHSAYNAEYSIFSNPGMLTSKSFLIALVGFVTGIVSIEIKKRIRRSLQTIDEKNQIINIFGQHVSPIVVDKLIRQKGELGSEMRFVCVMFLDIRNFTQFAESNAPEEVIHFLNSLFEFMVDIINENGGIINKFLGGWFYGRIRRAHFRRRRLSQCGYRRHEDSCPAQRRNSGRKGLRNQGRDRHPRGYGGYRPCRIITTEGIHHYRRCSQSRLEDRAAQ